MFVDELPAMTIASTLFDRYPFLPGYKATGTSQQAAESMRQSAATLRTRALSLLMDEPLTADEVAQRMNETVLAIRPRCTELLKLGLIEDSGKRRLNASGRPAIVWKAV